MKPRTFLLWLLLSFPAVAIAAMNAEEFDDFTRGKTFYYGSSGQPYGAEEYLSDRRVIWTFLNGECQNGVWYEDGGLICFVYDNEPDPQCWSFTRAPDGGLIARFENDPVETELYEVRRTPEPLFCPGPDVGV